MLFIIPRWLMSIKIQDDDTLHSPLLRRILLVEYPPPHYQVIKLSRHLICHWKARNHGQPTTRKSHCLPTSPAGVRHEKILDSMGEAYGWQGLHRKNDSRRVRHGRGCHRSPAIYCVYCGGHWVSWRRVTRGFVSVHPNNCWLSKLFLHKL